MAHYREYNSTVYEWLYKQCSSAAIISFCYQISEMQYLKRFQKWLLYLILYANHVIYCLYFIIVR